jgi:ubiquinone/menaquinone biosynthesis C-methylase UbiE
MTLPLLDKLRQPPDKRRALANYRSLAHGYDGTCTRIAALRLRALRALELREGETVFDIACGTGPTLPHLAQAVGRGGRVIGVELSPEMAQQARQRAAQANCDASIHVECCAVEDFQPAARADAMLLSYTHDVLQSPRAVERLMTLAQPGARIVLLGMKTLPWLWGWPVNAFNLYRARRYLTTYMNMDAPWRLLEARGVQFRLLHTALWGSAYISLGTLTAASAQRESTRAATRAVESPLVLSTHP